MSPASWARALHSVWSNRDRLGYSWRILSRGVCDGCSLGPRGLRDDVIPGLHLCGLRLDGLRRHTIGPLEPVWLSSIDLLRIQTPEQLEALGRLPFPSLRRRGERGFSRITWEDARRLGGQALTSADPTRIALLASRSGPTDEAWYALARAAELLGAPAPELVGMSAGDLVSTSSLADWIGTDLLLVWGAELSQQQPEALRYLAAAKEAGTRIVVVNPASEHALGSALGLRLADDLVQVKPGGDEALVRAVLKLLVRWGALDQDFVAQRTQGWGELWATLEPLSLDALLEQAGVRYNEAEWLARLVARANTLISVWSSGLRWPSAVGAVRDLHLARGAVGKPRTGWMALEPHPGAPGARLCGLRPYVPRAQEPEVALTFGALPAELAQQAASIPTRVHVALSLDPTTLLEPPEGGQVLLLPAMTRYEQPGGVVMSVERRIRYSPQVSELPLAAEARPDALVLAQLLPALGWADLAAVRAEMAERLPEYAGVQALHQDGEFVQWGGARLGSQGLLTFSSLGTP